jgi:hypothetical protein
MKNLLSYLSVFGLMLAILAPAAPTAQAYSSSYSIGGTTYSYYGSGGYGSSYNLGNTTYYSDTSGLSGSSYRLGNTRYYNYSYPSYYGSGYSGSISGNSYNLGNTTYYNFNSGQNYISGSKYRLGNTDYYNIGNSSYSCYWLGETYYCN